MINEMVIEGIVVREPWKYMEDLFFRIVTYRDSDLPARKLDPQRDAGDYLNIRVPGGANGLMRIQRGMRLRVHGFLQSRDFLESLEDFTRKARRERSLENLSLEIRGCQARADQVRVERSVNELIARRMIVLEATGRGARREQKDVPAREADTPPEEDPSEQTAPSRESAPDINENLIRSPKRVSRTRKITSVQDSPVNQQTLDG